MNEFLAPILLYAACLIGAIGVALALPRRKSGIALIGGLVTLGGIGLGALALFLWAADSELLPSIFFYVFGALALGSGLRMITHPRPVYSALYFILTIIASSGLYVILSAEFMAFALIIIYAGAIIITYLFVIMLATQAPTEDDDELLSSYDTEARDPIWSAAVGFVILAALTTMMFRGSQMLPPVPAIAETEGLLASMPRKVERELRRVDAIRADEHVLTENGVAQIDWDARLVALEGGNFAALPEGFTTSNVEELGFNLLADHPITLEIAGLILLMAMLGATVLARRQVDIEEAAKAMQARHLSLREGAGDA